MIDQIDTVLAQEVRAYFQSHGGDITVHSYDKESHTVFLNLHGQCAGCASKDESIDYVIKQVLDKNFPGISVQVENYISEELLDMARKILKKEG